MHLQRMELRGAFHSVQNQMEQKVSFRKFRFTSRGCPFFWKFGNSRKFLFHLAFLPRMNQSEFLYSWKATRWRRVFRVNTALAAKWSAIVRASVLDRLFSTKTLGSDFLENCGLVVPISCGSFRPVCILSHTGKFVSFSHKYQGRVEL